MYDGPCLRSALKTKSVILYCVRFFMGIQCNALSTGVM